MSENNSDMINIPNYSYTGKHRSNKKGGGVDILIHNSLFYKNRKDLELSYSSELEYIFVEIKTRQGPLIIGSMYRPPHTKLKQFINDYNLLLDTMKKDKEKDILIGVDHNMDLLKASKHKHTQNFLDHNFEEDLLPTITKLTRISKNCTTLLDNIFIRRLQSSFACGIIVTDLSDHLPTLLSLKNIRPEVKLQRTITYRKITKESIQSMDEEHSSYNWSELLKEMNTEDSFNTLHVAVVVAFNTHMPERTKKIGNKTPKSEPWMTNGIKNSIMKQKKLYRMTLQKNSNPAILEKYLSYRNILQVKRKAKTQYYRSRCKEFNNDTGNYGI